MRGGNVVKFQHKRSKVSEKITTHSIRKSVIGSNNIIHKIIEVNKFRLTLDRVSKFDPN